MSVLKPAASTVRDLIEGAPERVGMTAPPEKFYSEPGDNSLVICVASEATKRAALQLLALAEEYAGFIDKCEKTDSLSERASLRGLLENVYTPALKLARTEFGNQMCLDAYVAGKLNGVDYGSILLDKTGNIVGGPVQPKEEMVAQAIAEMLGAHLQQR